MRLIDVYSLELREFFGEDNIPPYAILSHTWTDEETTYQEWCVAEKRARKEKGYHKIKNACTKARNLGYGFLWCDTNCINKESSAELSEAINSMFTYYQDAEVCIVYLEDYRTDDEKSSLGSCRWFSRGWTLQELLAPKDMDFYDATWTDIGNKKDLVSQIQDITLIDRDYLLQSRKITDATIGKRMSWASARSTTRVEDEAYCLLGIFDINMPLLYGEGRKAFIRLQEEIIRHSNDHTIFCWPTFDGLSPSSTFVSQWYGCLAPRTAAFKHSAQYVGTFPVNQNQALDFQLTNTGLRITLPRLTCVVHNFSIAFLNATSADKSQVCICLYKSIYGTLSRLSLMYMSISRQAMIEELYLLHDRKPPRKQQNLAGYQSTTSRNIPELPINNPAPDAYAILPLFTDTNTFITFPYSGWRSKGEHIGPVIMLRESNPTGLWTASMDVRTASDSEPMTILTFDFYARIEHSEEGTWYVTWGSDMRYRWNNNEESKPRLVLKPQTDWLRALDLHTLDFTIRNRRPHDSQIITVQDEFEIKHRGKKLTVRPVLVSFLEILGSYWPLPRRPASHGASEHKRR